jgi:hypothetical protein
MPQEGAFMMSKYMQMKTRIHPYYTKRFRDAFPNIAVRLGRVDEAWIEAGPSLFDIVARLDKLLYELEGNPPFREILLGHKKALQRLYETVEENIGDWHLAKADKALYEMEDIFHEIERELGKI